MNPIDRAILQDEISQVLNALFKSGQVGRVEKTEIVVFPKTTITLEVETSGGTSRGTYQSNDGFPMTVGNIYKVYWNGKAYSLVCRLMTNSEVDGDIIEYRIIGNSGGVMGVADTGEPFGVIGVFTNDNLSVLMVTSFSANESATLSVSEVSAKTIHPIDPKFLPGVCLPVVELSQETMAGVFSSGTATCTAEEHAIIWGAYQALYPLIIKGNYNGIAFSGVSNILLDSAYTPYFEANAGALKVMVAFDDKTANIRSVQQ